jgi:hypothetical protein
MTVDPGSASLQGAVNWTKFTDSGDIPEWISTAYADSYQGPHDDEADADSAPGPSRISAPAVTPALLSAHYRLGLSIGRPGRAGSPSTRPTTRADSVPRCKWSPTTARC